MSLGRITSLVAACAVVVACVAGGALAADEGPFAVAEGGATFFPNQVYVVTLDQKRQLSSEDVVVTENGQPVAGVAVRPAASAQGIGTVLLIDSSNSMRGSIDDAMAAARKFAARNPGQPLSVVTFDKTPTVVLPFTTNQKAIKAALAKAPPLAEGTVMYDALAAAAAQARDSGLSAVNVVLVTDGADVRSTTTKDSAISQLQALKIPVYSVGIQSRAFTSFDIEQISAATGGSYAEATSSSALSGIYDALGFQLGNQYVVAYNSQAAPDKKVTVAIAVDGLGTQELTYTTPATGTGAPYEKPLWDRLLQSWVLVVGIVIAVIALLGYAIHLFLRLRANRRLRSRLGDFVTLPEEERARERRREVTAFLAAAHGTGSGMLRNRSWYQRFGEDVEVGEMKMSPTRLLVWGILGGLFVGLLAAFVLGSPWWLLAGLLVPMGIHFEVGRRADRMRKRFSEQLPENLEVMASALRAGHSLVGSMSVVVDQAAEPSRKEFRRVVTDEQLGVALDAALEVTARRMRNTDVDQVAVVAMLQREAGGNMAEVLDQVVLNIRARMALRRLVSVLTAQGRMARWILTGIPIFLVLFLLGVNPEHLDPLWHRAIGQVFLVVGVLMVIAGGFILKKITEINL
jgi:tight adherence protein B